MEEALDRKRKRLRFRSWHRGTKELDLLLGSFADRHLEDFDATQLERFELLLDVPEPVMFAWLTGHDSPPAQFRSDVMDLLIGFEYRPSGT